MTRVFVYGTLMPGESRWHLLASYADGTPVPAATRGTLVDTGREYPALQPGDALVPGYLVRLRPGTHDTALDKLDRIEGVDVGLFDRIIVRVSDGEAWAYRAADPSLPGQPIAAWPPDVAHDAAPAHLVPAARST